MKSKNICCEGQKVGQQLKGTFLFGSLGYRRFIFKISAPGLPGRYLYTTLYIYICKSLISGCWNPTWTPDPQVLKDTVQLVTAPAGRKAAYTKFGSGTGHPGRSGVEGWVSAPKCKFKLPNHDHWCNVGISMIETEIWVCLKMVFAFPQTLILAGMIWLTIG